MNDVINNSYAVGIGTRNLVLNTLGKVYVRVGDRYHELEFIKNGQVDHTLINNDLPDILVIDSRTELDNMQYPGDGKVVVSNDDGLWTTENGGFREFDFSRSINSLELEELSVVGPIQIDVANEAPFVINSTEMVRNLNTEFLGGIHFSEFPRRGTFQTIRGQWIFNNNTWFHTITVENEVVDNSRNIVIDFMNSSITVRDLTVTGTANLAVPPSATIQPLTIIKPDSTSVVYDGSSPITVDLSSPSTQQPLTIRLYNSVGLLINTVVYDGTTPEYIDVVLPPGGL